MIEDIDAELEQFQRGTLGKVRSAGRLALEHRRRVAAGDVSVFLFPLAIAMAKDGIFDVLSNIPIAGLIISLAFSFPIAVYLFIFMWGRGKWKLRILMFFVTIFGNFPVLSLVPFETLSVIYALHLARKEADKSKIELEKIGKVLPRLADNLRGSARQRARVQQTVSQEEAEDPARETNIVAKEAEPGSRPVRTMQPSNMEQLESTQAAMVAIRQSSSGGRSRGASRSTSIKSQEAAQNRASLNRLGEAAANEAIFRIRAAGRKLSAVESPRPVSGSSSRSTRSANDSSYERLHRAA